MFRDFFCSSTVSKLLIKKDSFFVFSATIISYLKNLVWLTSSFHSSTLLTAFIFINKQDGSSCDWSVCGPSGFIQALLTGLGGHYTNRNLCHRTYGRQIRAFPPGTETTTSLQVLCTLHFRSTLQMCGSYKHSCIFVYILSVQYI